MNSQPKTLAFSLVELVIAMGIAAVSLVTTIGILAASLNSRAKSADDTVLVAMTEHILSEIRSVPFDTLWAATPGGNPPVTQPTTPPEESRYYFSQEGDAVAADDVRTFYECIVRKTPDDGSRSANSGPFNLLKLELSFSSPFPASTPNRRPNERFLSASVARY